ncbi:MAG: hypothetical protein JWO78_1380 [Micavibrio sp.]|nr:hypothetical protein [Micavibrio sp.]
MTTLPDPQALAVATHTALLALKDRLERRLNAGPVTRADCELNHAVFTVVAEAAALAEGYAADITGGLGRDTLALQDAIDARNRLRIFIAAGRELEDLIIALEETATGQAHGLSPFFARNALRDRDDLRRMVEHINNTYVAAARTISAREKAHLDLRQPPRLELVKG